MRRLAFIIPIPILLLCGLTGCRREGDFKGVFPSPKLVVNSIINSDSTKFCVEVSSSRFALNEQPFHIAPDLRISKSGHSIPLQKRAMSTSRGEEFQYVGEMNPLNAGDKIVLSCSSDRYPQVQAEEIIPDLPTIVSVGGLWKLNKGEGRDRVDVRLTIRDSEREKNFYRIIVRSKLQFPHQPEEVFSVRDILIGSDPVLSIQGDLLKDTGYPPYVIFSDELIDGQQYELHFAYEDDYYEKNKGTPMYVPGTKYEAQVELQALSKSLYLYMHSLILNRNNDAFSEPVKVYSNIVDGYGILGIFSPIKKEIEVNLPQ